MNHERYGYTLKPNSIGKQPIESHEVTYTIDHDGARRIPRPWAPHGKILFVGGSFTFGHAVDDEQTIPYLLATQYWPEWHVVNKAVNAWSTTHSLLKIKDELQTADPPDVIIYGFIGHHVTRNYRRTDWIKGTGQPHPLFEIIDGNLAFQRLI